ncbi:MAG: glycoside hydrolase family 43 protein [Lentisphaeria bacterium]|nr:glycoside hydrolase family 43 protein [Lentisphaeria bacterium]
MHGYRNPVLPGFYPDPSVCRVGDDYYMVNSSFCYFPGVPVHHSKDMIHWEQIGHCITRPAQTRLQNIGVWNGIYAPTIRHHDGTFYMVTTNVSGGGNFYVTTKDPAGEWSDPIYVREGGIAPDLFFDDDGKTYLLTAQGAGEIHLAEIDLKTGRLLSRSEIIWRGTGGRCAEGPHMYKKDGWYYLMIAEGGTEYGHCETIARSRGLRGPFEACPSNPILSHAPARGYQNPIQGTGHADLIQAHDGSWWMVCLGFRVLGGFYHVTGRETFLAPVKWDENGWPVVNGNGAISLEMNVPTLPQVPVAKKLVRTDFDTSKLGLEWNYNCAPRTGNYSLTERPGWLRLKASPVSIDNSNSPTWLGRRQQQVDFESTAKLDAAGLNDGDEAGLTVYMCTSSHYDVAVRKRDGRLFLVLRYKLNRLDHTEKEIALESPVVCLRTTGNKDVYSFAWSADGSSFSKLGEMDASYLSSETAGGFTGVYLALYAQSRPNARGGYADFDWFEYKD